MSLAVVCFDGCVLPRANRAFEQSTKARIRVNLSLEPTTISLSEHRRATVRAELSNLSKQLIHLSFPSTLRVEMTLEDDQGRTLFTWSEDQRIDEYPGNLAINPREKAVYQLEFPTRGLKPGIPHTIKVFMPAHPEVQSALQFVPTS